MVKHRIAAPAADVFATITSVASLPEWNERIRRVVTDPGPLRPGSEWAVEMEVLGRRFESWSVALDVDRERGRFVHRSKPADPDDSHTVWTWEVVPADDGCDVTLTWVPHPVTPLKRLVPTPMRRLMLPAEARRSLRALAARCERSLQP